MKKSALPENCKETRCPYYGKKKDPKDVGPLRETLEGAVIKQSEVG